MNPLQRLLASPRPWIADAGLETAMIFHEGLDLPHFASFTLLDSDAGRSALLRYFDRFLDLARASGTGFVLDTLTWRANMGWAATLGLDEAGLRETNGRAVAFARDLRDRHQTAALPVVISGVVGPSSDAYRPATLRTADAYTALHLPQAEALAAAGGGVFSPPPLEAVGGGPRRPPAAGPGRAPPP
ncbi:MAG TPA: homocysteine S-methyltransferase family protein, partial [Paracoccaceae bacterium]|nr:homocysteine S-methyltransferase family protein [Paracoccaceae bacterium]